MAHVSNDVSEDSLDLPEEHDELSREERLERIEKIEKSKAQRRRKKIIRRIIWALIALFLIAIVAVFAAFVMWRWYTYDDTVDFQGSWRIEGTEKIIEITESTIVLTDDVAYKYTIDPQSKTITFKFGNMVGQARYRFSLDRQLLSITDGEFDMWTTLGDDMPWALAAVLRQMISDGAQLSPGQGDQVTELTRQLQMNPREEAADQDISTDTGQTTEVEDVSNEGIQDSSTASSSDNEISEGRDVDELDISDLGIDG